MSKIGKKPIIIPPDCKIEISREQVSISGPLGETTLILPNFIDVSLNDNLLSLKLNKTEKFYRAQYGLYRALLNNAVVGQTVGFKKKLEIHGVGFGATLLGNQLELKLGFSHTIKIDIPADLKVSIEKNIISVFGTDKQKVGQLCATVRALKKPDAYKGKGIRYQGEQIRLKPGKVTKAVGE